MSRFVGMVQLVFEIEADNWDEADELLQMETSYTIPQGRVLSEDIVELYEDGKVK